MIGVLSLCGLVAALCLLRGVQGSEVEPLVAPAPQLTEGPVMIGGVEYAIEGDILVPKKRQLAATMTTTRGWPRHPDGKYYIPYIFETYPEELSEWQKRDVIEWSMKWYELHTNIRFVEKTRKQVEKEPYYASFGRSYYGGCAQSVVGFLGDIPHAVLIGCFNRRTVLHELAHLLGLSHEHQRWDRDEHVYFYRKGGEFDRQGAAVNSTDAHFWNRAFATPYDHASVSHYESHNKDPNIDQKMIGFGGPSSCDLHLINIMHPGEVKPPKCIPGEFRGICKANKSCSDGGNEAACNKFCATYDPTQSGSNGWCDCDTLDDLKDKLDVHHKDSAPVGCYVAISGGVINGLFASYRDGGDALYREVTNKGKWGNLIIAKEKGQDSKPGERVTAHFLTVDGTKLGTYGKLFEVSASECLPSGNLELKTEQGEADWPLTFATRLVRPVEAPFIGTLQSSEEPKLLAGDFTFPDCYKHAMKSRDGAGLLATGMQWHYKSKECNAVFGSDLERKKEPTPTDPNHYRSMVFSRNAAPGTTKSKIHVADNVHDIHECSEKAYKKSIGAKYVTLSSKGDCSYSTKQNLQVSTKSDETVYLGFAADAPITKEVFHISNPTPISVGSDYASMRCNIAFSGGDVEGVYLAYDAPFTWRKVQADGKWSNLYYVPTGGAAFQKDGEDMAPLYAATYKVTFSWGENCLVRDGLESKLFKSDGWDITEDTTLHTVVGGPVCRLPFSGTLSGGSKPQLVTFSSMLDFGSCAVHARDAVDEDGNHATGVQWEYEYTHFAHYIGYCYAVFGDALKPVHSKSNTKGRGYRSMIFGKSLPAPGTVSHRRHIADGIEDIYKCLAAARKRSSNATYVTLSKAGKCYYTTAHEVHPSNSSDDWVFMKVDKIHYPTKCEAIEPVAKATPKPTCSRPYLVFSGKAFSGTFAQAQEGWRSLEASGKWGKQHIKEGSTGRLHVFEDGKESNWSFDAAPGEDACLKDGEVKVIGADGTAQWPRAYIVSIEKPLEAPFIGTLSVSDTLRRDGITSFDACYKMAIKQSQNGSPSVGLQWHYKTDKCEAVFNADAIIPVKQSSTDVADHYRSMVFNHIAAPGTTKEKIHVADDVHDIHQCSEKAYKKFPNAKYVTLSSEGVCSYSTTNDVEVSKEDSWVYIKVAPAKKDTEPVAVALGCERPYLVFVGKAFTAVLAETSEGGWRAIDKSGRWGNTRIKQGSSGGLHLFEDDKESDWSFKPKWDADHKCLQDGDVQILGSDGKSKATATVITIGSPVLPPYFGMLSTRIMDWAGSTTFNECYEKTKEKTTSYGSPLVGFTWYSSGLCAPAYGTSFTQVKSDKHTNQAWAFRKNAPGPGMTEEKIHVADGVHDIHDCANKAKSKSEHAKYAALSTAGVCSYSTKDDVKVSKTTDDFVYMKVDTLKNI